MIPDALTADLVARHAALIELQNLPAIDAIWRIDLTGPVRLYSTAAGEQAIDDTTLFDGVVRAALEPVLSAHRARLLAVVLGKPPADVHSDEHPADRALRAIRSLGLGAFDLIVSKDEAYVNLTETVWTSVAAGRIAQVRGGMWSIDIDGVSIRTYRQGRRDRDGSHVVTR